MYKLREYRPGRWARVDPETGKVQGLATDAEADAWIRSNLLDPAPSTPAESETPKPTRKRKKKTATAPTEAPALDVDSLKAGDLVCSACGAPWPGSFNGFWLSKNGDGPRQWYHWCYGGAPGRWHVAKPARKGVDHETTF
jgi:hypothetical protein